MLHVAALEAGDNPLGGSPTQSWRVPIRLEHETDDKGYVVSRLRDWKRRDGAMVVPTSTGGAPRVRRLRGHRAAVSLGGREITNCRRGSTPTVEVLERHAPSGAAQAVPVKLAKKR